MENKLQKPEDLRICLNLSVSDYKHLPMCAAVYIIFEPPNDVLYIGRAKRLNLRWRGDAHAWAKPVIRLRVAWFPAKRHELATLEKTLIQAYKPRYNIQHNRRS